jgi:predicted phage-related endonuclease
MTTRLALTLFVLLSVPALAQQTSAMQRIDQRYALHDSHMRPDPPPQVDQRAVLQRAIHEDAEKLTALSNSLKTDLDQLQKGMMSKELSQKLKQLEKLSKRLRQEVTQ